MKWEKFKYKFADLVENDKITKFNDFYKSLITMSNEDKGNYFEYLCKLYFKLQPFGMAQTSKQSPIFLTHLIQFSLIIVFASNFTYDTLVCSIISIK